MSTPRTSLPRLVTAAVGLVLTASACSMPAPAADEAPPDNPAGVRISGIEQDARFHGAAPVQPYEMPDITLTATNDQPFNLVTDTAYDVTLVFYGYTHCPDVCPLVLSDLTAAVLRLPRAMRDRTQVVFITTDPARDTPAVLRDYLDHYDERFVGLTGDLHDIVSAAEDMGVAIEGRNRLPGGGYDVGHGAQVIGFVGDQAPVVWTEGTSVSDLDDDIAVLSQLAG